VNSPGDIRNNGKTSAKQEQLHSPGHSIAVAPTHLTHTLSFACMNAESHSCVDEYDSSLPRGDEWMAAPSLEVVGGGCAVDQQRVVHVVVTTGST